MHLRIGVALLCSVFIPGAVTHAQVSPVTACTENKGFYQCDRSAFKQLLQEAKTVAIETQPSDRMAEKALGDMAAKLGKTESSDGADLTFVLKKMVGSGIVFGPGDEELADLRVYSRGPQGGQGQLVWVEIYHGQPDVAWGAVVHLTIQQFQVDTK